ncbi:uncharacterized protein LOC118313666 isoform X1 [Scophthalmus maximus]|uniref:uncharacterized protein LOC118313666 isoform X1 n=2 Tax=Scophthalmus maximus TaxID=52904 RepID=UPI0015E0B0A6|nr:uncharacterized protein LOC118313666 isoform X1 [Scophthalmus maximus]
MQVLPVVIEILKLSSHFFACQLMERLNRRVCHSQGRLSEDKEKQRKKEGEEMTLCLNECLRAVGLQHHYARFTSMGVQSAAHLSALTMEDYPILGIHTMEDRTRLFHIVQMVKTLDLESFQYKDGEDYGTDGGDEGYAVVDSSFTHHGYGDPNQDKYDDEEAATVPSSVRRRLDFSCETIDHHDKLPSPPTNSVHVCKTHNGNDVPVQGKGPATPLQLELDSGIAVLYGCKGNNNHRTDTHSRPSNHRTGGDTKPDTIGGIAMYNSHTRLSPKCVSFHKQKPGPATVEPKRFNSKPIGHKDRRRISKKEKHYTEIGSNGASGHMAEPTPIYELKRTVGYNYGLPPSSPPAQNKKQDGEQRIIVCVRKRPLTRAERRRGEADVVTASGAECVIVHEGKEAVDLTQYILQHRFYFDQVFGEESSNEEVYQRTAYPLVQHMLNGGKATYIAYGQTGAGKTHTMLGSSTARPGLYALAALDIFAHLSTSHMHSPLLVYVSFFEIYCGQLYDLLDHRKRLFAREDGHKMVHIAGLRDVRVDSVSSLLEVISQGTEERTQGMSGVNPLSSRSHAMMKIQLRGPNQQIAGRMWFVDLAGSEKASDTKEPDRQSRMEAAEINQSLLALKECIRSLDQEQSHTPFRQSKLTQVLKDSFVGDSMTCMIANISPGHLATEHTLNTLRYADRVKELRGHGGLRGGRRAKTIPSPKHNLSNSSNVGTRGRSPPKKQKLGRGKEAFGPTAPITRLSTGDTYLCSTPKNSRWGAETGAMGRKGTGLEHITPIRGWLGMNDMMHRKVEADERNVRRRENQRYGGFTSQSGNDQNIREPGIHQREKDKQQSTLKGGRQEERGWLQQRRQVEHSRDKVIDIENLRDKDLHKVDERDKERQRHLRRYHQQLQEFMSSSSSTSVNLLSSSTCPSFPSSNQASLHLSGSSSTCSPLRRDSRLLSSAPMYHGLEDVLDAYRAGVAVRADGYRGQLPFPSAEIAMQSCKLSQCCNNNDSQGDSGGVGEHWRVPWERTEARLEQDRGESDKRRTVGATAEVRLKGEDKKPAGKEGGERRWASLSIEQEDRVTGAMPTNVAAQVSHSCHSEDRRKMGEERLVPADDRVYGAWSTERAGGHHFLESPLQQAPAERPLSPAVEDINTLLTPNKLSDLSLESKRARCIPNTLPLLMQNAQFTNAPSTTQPLSTSITQIIYKIPSEPLKELCGNPVYAQVHNHTDVKAKMSGSHHDETYADTVSDIIAPLSISLLQVDQQVTRASFIQGEQKNLSPCLLENEKGEKIRREVEEECHTCAEMMGKVEVAEDIDVCQSFLELAQAKTHYHPTSNPAINHTDRGKDNRATYENCRIGRTKPPMPDIMLVSLKDQKNSQKPQTIPVLGKKAPASPLKPSTCDSMQTSVMQSNSPSDQQFDNMQSSSSHNLIQNRATHMPTENTHNMHKYKRDTLNLIPQSESVLDQFHILHSNHSSNNSLQPNSSAESNIQESKIKQQIKPIMPLATLEDMDYAQCRVVQAHWEQFEEMEALCHKEGTLLCQQPDMAFGEYVHKLEEIMERKAWCVHSMRAQLQPYLKPSHSNQTHNQ